MQYIKLIKRGRDMTIKLEFTFENEREVVEFLKGKDFKGESVTKAIDCKDVLKEIEDNKKAVAVPTSETAYTFPQLQKAAAELARAGKRDELKDIINSFGAAAITDIPEDRYNDLALKIREAGGVI